MNGHLKVTEKLTRARHKSVSFLKYPISSDNLERDQSSRNSTNLRSPRWERLQALSSWGGQIRATSLRSQCNSVKLLAPLPAPVSAL